MKLTLATQDGSTQPAANAAVESAANEVAAITAASPVPMTARQLRSFARKLPLQSVAQIRREAARVYRGMRFGLVEMSDGARLSFVLSGLVKMAEVADLETRLNALEKRINENE